MKLTIVGCAGSFPGPTSSASCYLLEEAGTSIVLDLGNGSLGALARYIDPFDLAGIALSHLHIDHCADVASFYVARKYRPDGPVPPIPVAGPVGTSDRLASIYDLPRDVGMHEQFDFVEYGPASVRIGPFTITPVAVNHCVPSFALRVEAGGRTLVYSGDTGPCQSLIDITVGADLALFEASYLSTRTNSPNMHLTGRQAAQHATAAGVDRLILTHLVAWYDTAEVLAEASEVYGGSVELAKPAMVVEV